MPFSRHEIHTDTQRKWGFQLRLALIELVFWLAIRLYLRLCRVTFINMEPVREAQAKGASCIYTCWHGDMYFCSYVVKNWKMQVMASRSDSGAMASAMLRASGNHVTRGGSGAGKGGSEALDRLTQGLKDGKSAAIIADAPKGPRFESKMGPVLAAARSGSPIYPAVMRAQRAWSFSSWDRGWIPKPFSRVCVIFGDPIHVPADLSREEMEAQRLGLTEKMIALGEEAERRVE